MCVKLHVDANIAGPEDPVAGFVDDTLNTVTAQCLPCVTADVQISGQCLAEDDLDDIAEFPIFTKRSSRRLRRTSIEIYRKSLHDAENIADEEECDAASVFFDSSETTADHVEMNSTNDGILGDELAPLSSESNQSVMLRTIEVENVNTQSDVQTAQLPSIANSDSVVKSETGILCLCDLMMFVVKVALEKLSFTIEQFTVDWHFPRQRTVIC